MFQEASITLGLKSPMENAISRLKSCITKSRQYTYGIIQSMSRVGSCWDNPVAESFFKSLKAEMIY